MKKTAVSALVVASAFMGSMAFASAAYAGNTKAFKSSVEAPITTPVQVNVIIGDELAYRAEHISPKLRDRSNARSLRDGFAGRGFYGQRELDELASRMERKLTSQLEKRGFAVSGQAATVLNVVITDADPSSPTFEQMSKNVSLSSRSFALGGAKFEASLTINGQPAGDLSYSWYESDIRHASYGGGIWTDANRAIDRFAKKTAKSLN